MRHVALSSALCLLAVACGDDAEDATRNADTASVADGGRRMDGGSRSDGGTRGRDASSDARADAGQPPQEDSLPPIVRDDDCPSDAPLAVDRIRIYPGPDATLSGVQFEGSNEGTTVGFVELGKLDEAPKAGSFTELSFDNATIYRYVRFFDPQGRPAPLAEVEFYHGDTKLSGKAFGTVGSAEHPFAAAFDGDLDTYYEGQTAGGNYVGLDIAGEYVAGTPTFTPAPGALNGAATITLATTTRDAAIHYTTDGSTPNSDSPLYEEPIAAGDSRLSLRAISLAKCHFASAIATATYGVAGEPVAKGQKSYHLGNSLTDVIDGFLAPVADSTGVTHSFARWTIPGCQISWQADAAHVNDGTAIPEASRNVASFVKSFAPDHMSVQPFTDPTIANEGPAALKFLQPAVAANPNMQAWVYAQWPSTKPTMPDNEGKGYLQDELARGASWASWPAPAQKVPDTWEDTTDARMRYYEAFADFVDEKLDGKPVLIVPGGPALATLKRRIDAGQFPGLNNFFAQVFGDNDDLHLRNNGRYLIALVFYSCMYRANPVDAVSYVPEGVTAEQAKALRQIAWETASGYPRCGIAQ